MRFTDNFYKLIVVALLIFLNTFGYFLIGGTDSALVCLFYQVLIVCLSPRISRPSYLAVVIFNLIMFLGLCSVGENLYNFDMQFAPYGDDSYFYVLSLERPFANIFTLTVFSAIKLASWFHSNVQLIDVLPVIYLFGTFSILLIRKITFLITGVRLKFAYLIVILILNTFYLDILIHSYRDIFIVTFYLLFIWALLRKKYFISLVFFALVFQLRMENGIIALLFGAFYFMGNRGRLLSSLKLPIIITAFICLIAVNTVLEILPGSIMPKGKEEMLYNQYLEERLENLEEKASEGQLTTMLMRSTWGQPLRPLATVISPLSPRPVEHHEFRVSTKFYAYTAPSATLFFSEPVNWITTLLLLFIIPRVIIGCWRMYKRNEALYVLLTAAITILLVTYISLQTRHRTAFIVFYPVFIAYFLQDKMSKKEKLVYNSTIILLAIPISFSFLRMLA